MKKPRPMKGKFWAYFAPNGYLQVRTLATTKALSREELVRGGTSPDFKVYELMGFRLLRVDVNIQTL